MQQLMTLLSNLKTTIKRKRKKEKRKRKVVVQQNQNLVLQVVQRNLVVQKIKTNLLKYTLEKRLEALFFLLLHKEIAEKKDNQYGE